MCSIIPFQISNSVRWEQLKNFKKERQGQFLIKKTLIISTRELGNEERA